MTTLIESIRAYQSALEQQAKNVSDARHDLFLKRVSTLSPDDKTMLEVNTTDDGAVIRIRHNVIGGDSKTVEIEFNQFWKVVGDFRDAVFAGEAK